MHQRLDERHHAPQGSLVPRWTWRGVGAATALGLLLTGEAVGALSAVVAFAAAEVVFDAADVER
ncbi:hypothetical protein L615_001200000210 [Nocardioides sp. J9]|uniref:hypothetical protein n=1 Tax=Nocardioides sp. J9 TaxID=935844 RepID=UPI0011AB1B62|nr:hypothetical protein [Nocardioides sp. J9]TWH03152.1 hypothetical protein L615_001200000210 [Nocardioides sp. J9]